MIMKDLFRMNNIAKQIAYRPVVWSWPEHVNILCDILQYNDINYSWICKKSICTLNIRNRNAEIFF